MSSRTVRPGHLGRPARSGGPGDSRGAGDPRGPGDSGGPAASTRARGREAEEGAARFLEREGYRVLARNHACRRGEVDLVCEEQGTLCFVEVRSRGSRAFGSPARTIDVAKRRRIVAAATDWAVRHGGLERAMRFDVVAVDLSGAAPRFELLRGAFDASGAAW